MAGKRFAVFGAGGVGGHFAAALARAGFWVGVVARGANLEAIRRSGLRVQSPRGDFHGVPAQASDNPADIGAVDGVILAVKAWQVPEAARSLHPLIGPGTKVLTLQNGVEAHEQVAEAVGRRHVLIGLCRILCSVTAPGRIHDAGLPPTIALGEPENDVLSPQSTSLASALSAAGVTIETPPDIHAALWGKLLLIAAFSGVGAVTRSTIGEIRDCPAARGLMQRVMAEVEAVGRSMGVRMDVEVVPRTLAFVDTLPAAGTASMQRHIAEERPSELEGIIGVVIRLGARTGVATPALDGIYASLLPQEHRARARLRGPGQRQIPGG